MTGRVAGRRCPSSWRDRQERLAGALEASWEAWNRAREACLGSLESGQRRPWTTLGSRNRAQRRPWTTLGSRNRARIAKSAIIAVLREMTRIVTFATFVRNRVREDPREAQEAGIGLKGVRKWRKSQESGIKVSESDKKTTILPRETQKVVPGPIPACK